MKRFLGQVAKFDEKVAVCLRPKIIPLQLKLWTMDDKIRERLERMMNDIRSFPILNTEYLEAFRIKYLGSKNAIKPLFGLMKEIAPEMRKAFGQELNAIKQAAEQRFEDVQAELAASDVDADSKDVPDLSLPSYPFKSGARHPVDIVMNKIIKVFERIGFAVAEDREVEDDWHNFTAMNTPEDHPARDMQDTFYVMNDPTHLLRTHTSSVQARVMTKTQPPIRIIAPGRVFRNETISARSHCQFHQIEGLYVDEGVSFADMKQTLLYYAREMYGEEVKIRLRPSYFPFTEPSAEMDVYWGLESEIDYRITKGTGWLEVLGCGMVDPAVLENCGIDSEKYTGFAFGMGIERQALFTYRIPDIRMLFENDIRFLEQFVDAI
jgi:phenylalanyl-tRNA synthetase alpha chain